MTMKRWAGPLVLSLALVLVGAACGHKGGTTASAGGSGATQSSSGGGGGGNPYGGYGYGGSGKSSGTSSAKGASALTVKQTTALKFVPATFSVKSGSTITLHNVTTAVPHNFTVKGQSINVTTSPGQSTKVKIALKPGTYQFFCKFHVAQGMKGTLTVT